MAEDQSEEGDAVDDAAIFDDRLADIVPIDRSRSDRDGSPATAPSARPMDRPKVRHAVGDVIRAERSAQGRTLREVATDAAVSLPYLSEVERGRKEISSDLLESVCDSLGVDVSDVLRRAADRLDVGMDRRPQLRLAA